MKTKLLRALAHLKAAQSHVREAVALLQGRDCYLHSTGEKVVMDVTAIQGSISLVSEIYMRKLMDSIKPAELK